MANILCVIELREGHALPVCLEALGQGRRLSSKLGATLYAVVPLARAPRYGEDDLIAQLAKHGADKVVLVTDESLSGLTDGMRWGAHGHAISLASDLLPPSLLLFGATAGAREVAPRAAARMGAAYVADAWVEAREDRLAVFEGEAQAARALEGDLEFPVVATLPPGRYRTAAGDDEAEVEVLNAAGRPIDFDELGWEADPNGRPVVLCAGDAAGAGAELAEALGGTAGPELGDQAAPRLVVSLGPGLDGVVARVKVAIGEKAAEAPGAHYALTGAPADAAKGLAAAIRGDDEEDEKEPAP
jgi:electron transfer flavoprotein alpha subunit